MNTTPNGYTTIDRRPKLSCGCGCGQEAALPHFVKVGAALVLPQCLEAHQERQAAQRQLRAIVSVTRAVHQRVRLAVPVYRLQRSIFARQGAHVAHRTALRTALIYVLGTRVGLWLSRLWRKG